MVILACTAAVLRPDSVMLPGAVDAWVMEFGTGTPLLDGSVLDWA